MEDIILASSSPRRREILEKYGIKHSVVKSEIYEKIYSEDSPEQIAMSLSFEKAYNVGLKYRDNIVIGADTIVVFEDEILGKPQDESDASRMLNLLSGKEHMVITGLSLVNFNKNIKIVDYEKTMVRFRKLDKDIIQRYIDTKEPFDKAGAYGIQGYGALLVEKINGCYHNVVGLPLGRLSQLLYRYFDINII